MTNYHIAEECVIAKGTKLIWVGICLKLNFEIQLLHYSCPHNAYITGIYDILMTLSPM